MTQSVNVGSRDQPHRLICDIHDPTLLIITPLHTSIVANLYATAFSCIAVSPDAELRAIERGKRYAFDYGSG